MNRYGLFNDLRQTDADACFFAIQAAVSSYPGDPLRTELGEIVGSISTLTDQAQQSVLAAKGAGLLSRAVPFIEYCVWDYTLVSTVALKEFASWVDDIQKLADTPPESGDVTHFVADDTSYFVTTLVVLSCHPALASWLQPPDEATGPHARVPTPPLPSEDRFDQIERRLTQIEELLTRLRVGAGIGELTTPAS